MSELSRNYGNNIYNKHKNDFGNNLFFGFIIMKWHNNIYNKHTNDFGWIYFLDVNQKAWFNVCLKQSASLHCKYFMLKNILQSKILPTYNKAREK